MRSRNSLPSGGGTRAAAAAAAAFHFPPIGQTKSVRVSQESVIFSDSALAFVDFYENNCNCHFPAATCWALPSSIREKRRKNVEKPTEKPFFAACREAKCQFGVVYFFGKKSAFNFCFGLLSCIRCAFNCRNLAGNTPAPPLNP